MGQRKGIAWRMEVGKGLRGSAALSKMKYIPGRDPTGKIDVKMLRTWLTELRAVVLEARPLGNRRSSDRPDFGNGARRRRWRMALRACARGAGGNYLARNRPGDGDRRL